MLVDLKLRLDFALRPLLAVPLFPVTRTPRIQSIWADEVDGFLDGFDWRAILGDRQGNLRVADIGARHFALAPRLERRFRSLGVEPELHGIEIDAYRRLGDGRTQAQYGRFHARRVAHGTYHPIDFLKFREPIDVALLLHPFVSRDAHLAWGLPLALLRPRELFEHAAGLLRPRNGILVACAPTSSQKEESTRLARAAGFRPVQFHDWLPTDGCLQAKPRLGTAFRLD